MSEGLLQLELNIICFICQVVFLHLSVLLFVSKTSENVDVSISYND